MTYVVVAKVEDGHIYFDAIGPFMGRRAAEKFVPRLRGYEVEGVMGDPAGAGRPHGYLIVDRREVTDPFDYLKELPDDL